MLGNGNMVEDRAMEFYILRKDQFSRVIGTMMLLLER